MKLLSQLLKIICVAANWYFSLMMAASACLVQSPGRLIAAQLWILIVILTFPPFKKKVPHEDKRTD